MRAVRPLVPPILALLAAAFVLLNAAPAGAARGTAAWAVLEHEPAKAKVRRPVVLAQRADASPTKSKSPVRKRAGKPRKRATKPVRAAVPPVTTPAVPNDPLWRESWSLAKVNLTTAWSATAGAPGTVVAVLDTGVELGHPDLRGALVAGYDTVNEDADPSDDHGHGTMVAGVVGARANNGIGGTGTCWRCSIMPVKVIGSNGLGTPSDIAEGILWATTHGARVINMSFTLSGPADAVGAAIEQARAQGVVVVAAAGNAGSAEATHPAAYPGVVSVAATDAADGRYAWSSYGGWVRLAAPGCSMTTAPGGAYGEFCGTSSAAAFVSGVAGVMRSFAGRLAPDGVATVLTTSAVRVGDFVAGGRVDAAASLAALRSQTR